MPPMVAPTMVPIKAPRLKPVFEVDAEDDAADGVVVVGEGVRVAP